MQELFLEVPQQFFAEWTVRQIRRGFGLVPFIGSGLSAPSGILTGQDFTNYITWTVYRCVADAEPTGLPCHDLQRDGWPEPPSQREADEAKAWVWKKFIELSDHVHVEINGHDAETNRNAPLAEMQVHSLAYKSTASALQCDLLRPLVPSVISTSDSTRLDRATRALMRSLGREELLRRLPPHYGQFTTSLSYVTEAAIHSLYEWRATLDFLARLRVDHTRQDLPLRLDDQVDQSIIDRFNIGITRGRRPNLAHNMLCHLAGRARINTILTTNFDNLIETAFIQLGEHLEVIPVSIRGEMPAPATVLLQGCVVKLHGDLLETRADHSLDESPSHNDLRRFFEYVMGRPPGVQPEEGHLPGLLLVCGYSGSDMRCIQMIQHVLEADTKAKVLWVCHNQRDISKVRQLFSAYTHQLRDTPPTREHEERDRKQWERARVIATVTNRCDLLFYEIYQRLTLSLPRGGFNYQFSSNVPPGLDDPHYLSPSQKLNPAQEKLKNELLDELQKSFDQQEHPPARNVLCVDGDSGLLPVVREVYREVTEAKRKQGIWLWLGDHNSTVSLAHELLTVIALRIGRFQLDHALFGTGKSDISSPSISPASASYQFWQPWLNRLLEHWGVNPDAWFIVIDGRNGTGTCADWSGAKWNEEEYNKLSGFLGAVQDARNHRAPSKGFHVLYAPFTSKRHARMNKHKKCVEALQEKIGRLAADESLKVNRDGDSSFFEDLAKGYQADSGEGLDSNDQWGQTHEIDDCAGWTEGRVGWSRFTLKEPPKASFDALLDEVHKEFFARDAAPAPGALITSVEDRTKAFRALYGALLFRQSRHFSAFMSEGVYPCPTRFNCEEVDNDWTRHQDIDRWLRAWKSLSKGALFHGKPGGFAWMYRDVRLGLRGMIDAIEPIQFDSEHSYLQNAREARARMHYWIGDWYMRAHRATAHAEPLLEALYHFSNCILASVVARPSAKFQSCEKTAPSVRGQAMLKAYRYDIKAYQRRYARRALMEMIKALRVGRREIRFWIQEPAGESWFQVRKDGGSWIADQFKRVFSLQEKPAVWEPWIHQFNDELAQLPQAESPRRIVFRRALALPLGNPRGGGSTEEQKHQNQEDFLNTAPFFAGTFDVLQRPDAWWEGIKEWIKEKFQERGAMLLHRSLVAIQTHLAEHCRLENYELSLELKRTMIRVSDESRANPRQLYILIQALSEITYGTIQCAKRLENVLMVPRKLKREHQIQRIWVEVCAMSWAVLDLCVEIPPVMHAVDCAMRIKTSTLYGLALARLGRFFEAHRRFNEAHGWLSKSEARLDPLQAAIIEIRRSEAHLLEAVRIKHILIEMEDFALGIERLPPAQRRAARETFTLEKLLIEEGVDAAAAKQWCNMYVGTDDALGQTTDRGFDSVYRELARIHIAKLDDAWRTAELVEQSLSGTTHSTLWWGHLYVLKMRIYAEHWWLRNAGCDGVRKLHCSRMLRISRDHLPAIQKLYHASLVSARLDIYRHLRLLNYTIQAELCAWRHLLRGQADIHPTYVDNYGTFKKRLKEALDGMEKTIDQNSALSDSAKKLLHNYRGSIFQNFELLNQEV